MKSRLFLSLSNKSSLLLIPTTCRHMFSPSFHLCGDTCALLPKITGNSHYGSGTKLDKSLCRVIAAKHWPWNKTRFKCLESVLRSLQCEILSTVSQETSMKRSLEPLLLSQLSLLITLQALHGCCLDYKCTGGLHSPSWPPWWLLGPLDTGALEGPVSATFPGAFPPGIPSTFESHSFGACWHTPPDTGSPA